MNRKKLEKNWGVLSWSWSTSSWHTTTQKIKNLFTIDGLLNKYKNWYTSRPIKIELKTYTIEDFLDNMFKTLFFTERDAMAISIDWKNIAYICSWIHENEKQKEEDIFSQYQAYLEKMPLGSNFILYWIDWWNIRKSRTVRKSSEWVDIIDTSSDIVSIRLSWAWTSSSINEQSDYWARWWNSIGPWWQNRIDRATTNEVLSVILWNKEYAKEKSQWTNIVPLSSIV